MKRREYRRIFASKTGRAIREAREERGISQESLARLIDVSQTTISNWEYGLYFPKPPELVAISVELGISLDELFKPMVELYKNTITRCRYDD